MKILLAEDDANLSIITQLCLEKMGGHEVDVKADGELALHAALAGTYDLILLDGMMPKLTGLQVAASLQSSGKAFAPIIFLSAKNQAKDIQEFLKFGIGYIPKPFDPQSMCDMINDILAKNKGASA